MLGVIAAGHPQTVEAGEKILRQGGNAVDAAVAATFASFIAEPALVNIGGGGIAQIYNPANGEAVVYDFFSAMPGLGRAPAPRLDFPSIAIDFGPVTQQFYIGRGSVAIPGVVAGLCQMAAELGSLPLPAILAPAIRLARQGVILTDMQAYIIHLLEPIMTHTPEITALFAPGGALANRGTPLALPALANTLEQLSREGPALFYTGAVGQQIIADQQANGGLITSTDLAAYKVRRMKPLTVGYRGYTVLLPPPSSSGGMLIAFALKLLETIPLDDVPHGSFRHLRVLIEVMRLTNAARAAWNAKTQTASPPPADLAGQLLAPDNLKSYTRQLRDALAQKHFQPGPPEPSGKPNTSHLSVADARGMLVGITTSAGENAGFVVGDTGVMLNNMLGEADLHPNGFHKLPPGQRLATMMSPVIVKRGNRPVLVVGSGGSNRLRTAILQVISNLLDFKMPLFEAVDTPRLHFEDNITQLEGGIAPNAADLLDEAGYNTNRWPYRNMYFGGAHAVAQQIAPNGAELWAAAGDRRRGGTAKLIV